MDSSDEIRRDGERDGERNETPERPATSAEQPSTSGEQPATPFAPFAPARQPHRRRRPHSLDPLPLIFRQL